MIRDIKLYKHDGFYVLGIRNDDGEFEDGVTGLCIHCIDNHKDLFHVMAGYSVGWVKSFELTTDTINIESKGNFRYLGGCLFFKNSDKYYTIDLQEKTITEDTDEVFKSIPEIKNYKSIVLRNN
jgi:hypothetical protein